MKKLFHRKPPESHSAVSYTGEDSSKLMEDSAASSTWCLVSHVSAPKACIMVLLSFFKFREL